MIRRIYFILFNFSYLVVALSRTSSIWFVSIEFLFLLSAYCEFIVFYSHLLCFFPLKSTICFLFKKSSRIFAIEFRKYNDKFLFFFVDFLLFQLQPDALIYSICVSVRCLFKFLDQFQTFHFCPVLHRPIPSLNLSLYHFCVKFC